ncbi:hypothetical protein DLEV_086 [Diachasmimorpha longicaudata entomopoxvirus]|uniref:Uncharacterized protein n=1 Tax=Diachasmimorpha longicaudata entomopoxvirus TaxID=109981 RepID=A0A7R5WU83_9POXV|nr:hypothetical protein QKK69_gp086 [Diachasmimorpha longicaudata entomopoxvirus]AKS26377.1 hypothetical protein DLEV_086 [Diachasmimorpha longicaudata entomopoxvirus]
MKVLQLLVFLGILYLTHGVSLEERIEVMKEALSLNLETNPNTNSLRRTFYRPRAIDDAQHLRYRDDDDLPSTSRQAQAKRDRQRTSTSTTQ